MPESCQKPPDEVEVPTAGSVSWRCWPLVEEWPGSMAKVALAAAMCVLAGVAFGGVGYGVLAAAMLGLSLARYFLPARYELDEAGACRRGPGGTSRLPWGQVRRVVVVKAGVFLSPREKPSRLDSFGGLFLPFAGNAAEVTAFVADKTRLVAPLP